MIALGTALKSTEYPYHRCVVLVRVTTDDGTWPDRDCLLRPTDWIELEHASTVAYSTCKFGPVVQQLENAIQRRMFREIASPPPEVLRRMISAARIAAGMPPGARKLLADETAIN